MAAGFEMQAAMKSFDPRPLVPVGEDNAVSIPHTEHVLLSAQLREINDDLVVFPELKRPINSQSALLDGFSKPFKSEKDFVSLQPGPGFPSAPTTVTSFPLRKISREQPGCFGSEYFPAHGGMPAATEAWASTVPATARPRAGAARSTRVSRRVTWMFGWPLECLGCGNSRRSCSRSACCHERPGPCAKPTVPSELVSVNREKSRHDACKTPRRRLAEAKQRAPDRRGRSAATAIEGWARASLL
eukprot:CAMPEP_0117516694 /NCGR_PEP_ID=MMETSP0784-20121206/31225_1 /TAXON_ID=39447 /ORGANISM="" /LENGTH=243 /DNA_ID=CAMNT_0005312545 /DNA_START=31 /DNA_END=763 /DNA_ORIENTATION=-